MGQINNLKLYPEMEQRMFCRHLYHDARGGRYVRFAKANKEQRIYADWPKMLCLNTADTYVSLATYRTVKGGRKADNIFNRSVLYIDIDAHQGDVEKTKKLVEDKLEEAYADGELAVPTMITSTGRGFGIYYCLKKSIAYSAKTEKSRKLFEYIYGMLIERYADILKDVEDADVDTKVTDVTRVVRLPGTINSNTGTLCRLISLGTDDQGNELYYDLNDIKAKCKLMPKPRQTRQTSSKPQSKPVIVLTDATPMLARRVKMLTMLRDLRGADVVDNCREQMCFIVYSAFVQIYQHDDAVKKLYEFNDNFVVPLAEEEILHIIDETDDNEAPDKSYNGYYKLPNSYVARTLSITEAEAKEIGWSEASARSIERAEKRKKKADRNTEIIRLAKTADMTYDAIAVAVGVSVRTVKYILAKAGVSRYATIEKDEKNKQTIKISESAEIATESKGCACLNQGLEGTTPLPAFSGPSEALPSPSGEESVPERKIPNKDKRLMVLDKCEEYADLSEETKALIEPVLRRVKHLNMPAMLINGRSVPFGQIRQMIKDLTYKDIYVVGMHIQRLHGNIQSPLWYVISCFWYHYHPEDRPVYDVDENTGGFCQFDQRDVDLDALIMSKNTADNKKHYDYDDLERALKAI